MACTQWRSRVLATPAPSGLRACHGWGKRVLPQQKTWLSASLLFDIDAKSLQDRGPVGPTRCCTTCNAVFLVLGKERVCRSSRLPGTAHQVQPCLGHGFWGVMGGCPPAAAQLAPAAAGDCGGHICRRIARAVARCWGLVGSQLRATHALEAQKMTLAGSCIQRQQLCDYLILQTL